MFGVKLLSVGRSLFLPVPLVVDRESTTAIASDHGGTEGRPPPRVVSVMRPRIQEPDESARRFILARSTPRHAACSGPEGRRRCWSALSSTVAPRPWRAANAFTKSPRTRSASDTMRSAWSQARRAVAAGDADPNRQVAGG